MEIFATKTGKAVTVIVVLLVIVAVAVPIYISTLKRETGENSASESNPQTQDGSNFTGTTIPTHAGKLDTRPALAPTVKIGTTATQVSTHENTGKIGTTTATPIPRHENTGKIGTTTATPIPRHENTGKIGTTAATPIPRHESTGKTGGTTPATQEDQAYNSNGSLSFANREFYLNDTRIRLLSGAVHYFRMEPSYWGDRLLKLKACGMNTVETYVPWNLHEIHPGQFDFEGILDVRKFIQLAQTLGLHVIFRPGPYICSEWDFGGLPAWLLSDPNMKVRSNYKGYTDAVERFFNKLLPMVEDLQYSRGGPIIAFQIENEFGSYSSDIDHLKFLKNLYIQHNLTELFLTSDNVWGHENDPFYQHALPTANFQTMSEGRKVLDKIREYSKDFPLMVTEFWTGWFDHWGSKHGGLALDDYESSLTSILNENASVNFYMFLGGTNFGFMNGANKEDNKYKPDVSSYDYDALLTEKGDITPKYLKTRDILLEHIYKPQGTATLPEIPRNISSRAYGSVSVDGYCPLENVLNSPEQKKITSSKAVPMEMLKLYGDYGQNYGYILYRCTIPGQSSLLSFERQPTDRAQIYVDGVEVTVLDWKSETTDVQIPHNDSKADRQLDILVENNGRVNYAKEETGILNSERKGINGFVKCDNTTITNFTIFPQEFKNDTVTRNDWQKLEDNPAVPALFKATLNITGDVNDSFIYMKGWGKGIVFMNGFNLGRYWIIGPQQTLYVPAPLLKEGNNQIVVFETDKMGTDIVFTDKPILDVNNQTEITNL